MKNVKKSYMFDLKIVLKIEKEVPEYTSIRGVRAHFYTISVTKRKLVGI